MARNENRPHFLDYINGIVDDWTYLAGDRLFGEDPAMCGGIGYWRGDIPAVIIGQEKGRTIETRQFHRFGMPNPEGYRKSQRLMRLAEKFQLPVITLFDTAGAFAGSAAEERGQSQAVASSIATGNTIRCRQRGRGRQWRCHCHWYRGSRFDVGKHDLFGDCP